MASKIFPTSICTAIFTAVALPLAAQQTSDPVVDSIYALKDDQLKVMATLDELSNGIGPRLTSSKNLTEACEWAKDKFTSYGLSNSRLEEWGTFPVGFDRRFSAGAMTSPHKLELSFNTNSWTPGTDGKVSGPAIVAPKSDEELMALKGNLKNAWILCSTTKYSPRFNRPDSNEFRDQFGRMCAKEGYAGVIRPSGKSGLLLTRGRYKIDADDLPQHTQITLLRDHFTTVHELAKNGENVHLEFDIDQSFTPGPIPLYNVLAEIPGTDLANEIVIVGGHIDSWDGARGAQDNGTGTSTTLEAARILQAALNEHGLQPRRTIRFMLWSGEEQGLLGSRAYIEQHPEENELISAVLVHDGGTNTCSGIQTTPELEPIFNAAFEPIINHSVVYEDEDLRFRLVPVEKLPRGIGSDHDAYLSAGVPGFFWSQNGDANYTYIHHTQHDTIAEVVPEYQRASVRVIASAAWRIANLDERLPRNSIGGRNQRRARTHALGVYLGEGLTIDDIVKGGLAEQAGMMAGDVILSVAGTAIATTSDLRKVLSDKTPQREVIWSRNGQKMKATFDWAEKKVSNAILF